MSSPRWSRRRSPASSPRSSAAPASQHVDPRRYNVREWEKAHYGLHGGAAPSGVGLIAPCRSSFVRNVPVVGCGVCVTAIRCVHSMRSAMERAWLQVEDAAAVSEVDVTIPCCDSERPPKSHVLELWPGRTPLVLRISYADTSRRSERLTTVTGLD